MPAGGKVRVRTPACLYQISKSVRERNRGGVERRGVLKKVR